MTTSKSEPLRVRAEQKFVQTMSDLMRRSSAIITSVKGLDAAQTEALTTGLAMLGAEFGTLAEELYIPEYSEKERLSLLSLAGTFFSLDIAIDPETGELGKYETTAPISETDDVMGEIQALLARMKAAGASKPA